MARKPAAKAKSAKPKAKAPKGPRRPKPGARAAGRKALVVRLDNGEVHYFTETELGRPVKGSQALHKRIDAAIKRNNNPLIGVNFAMTGPDHELKTITGTKASLNK